MSYFDLSVVYGEYFCVLNNAVTQAANDQILNFSRKENPPQSTVKHQSCTATQDNWISNSMQNISFLRKNAKITYS